MTLRVVTAGESHGPGLTCVVEGLPAGLELDLEAIDRDMARRQLGHGRGGRMKIERDSAEVTAGVRHGRTLGGPIALRVANRDYANWEERMNPWPVEADVPEVHLPRPGHADLAGVQKFGFTDVRNVLERASARETAARVAGGALAKGFLRALGVRGRLARHPDRLGAGAGARRRSRLADFADVDASPVRCLDADAIARRWSRRSTCCASATSRSAASSRCSPSALVPGLGSHVSWEERLDGRIGLAMLSIQAIKGCGIGDGFDLAGRPGSAAHDEIFYSEERGYYRETNRSGGIEGGMTTGEPLVVRCAHEAAADADQAAALGRHRHARAGAGAARAHRLLHRARGRRGGGGDARDRARLRLPGEVRRRPHRRRARRARPPTSSGSAGSR